jgi:mono/diheme cytochrome c family protein
MRKFWKWIGIGLLTLVGITLAAGVILYTSASLRLNKTYTLPPETVTVPTGMDAVNRGQRLVITRCVTCHGETLAGKIIFQDPMLGTIAAPNISGGRGGNEEPLNDADFIHIIRHGVGQDGKALLVMPSEAFYYLTDQDLSDIFAYLRSTPQVENPLPATHIKPFGMALIGAGVFGKIMPAEEIDHQAARPEVIEPGVTHAYGDYLVRTAQCRTCHGPDLAGGKDPDPNAPPAPDLTSSGKLAGWSEEEFTTTLRTGRTPDGRLLNLSMPWKYIGQMTDEELKAIWLYLQSLPPRVTAN